MLYHSLQITNYRCYANLFVQFQPGMNVVAGVNGSGKTSLLKAVSGTMTGMLAFLQGTPGYMEPLEDDDIRVVVTEAQGLYRFEPQYPVCLEAEASLRGNTCHWTVRRDGQSEHPSWDGELPGKRWSASEWGDVNNMDALPVLAFYPAYRQWPPQASSELTAVTARDSRLDGYRSWWEASSEVAVFRQWIIGKSMERLQRASERRMFWDDIHDDELAWVNAAIAKVVENAKGLRYDFSRRAIVIEWSEPGRPPTLFDNLSDGQRVAVALVADIARRMCLLNPQLGLDVTAQTSGVVLIDEIDIHLHPAWQRLMVEGLANAFPKVQFIASSHSPQILGELNPEQIILLTEQGVVHPVASYGLDASRVLEQVMGAPARTVGVDSLLTALFVALERNELDLAREQMESMKAIAPDLPELVRAEALLKRKEVLGR